MPGKHSHSLVRKTRPSYSTYQARATKFGLDFTLTREEFRELVDSPCHYCGVSGPNGIDRKDNTLGYLKENALPACIHCNYAKGNLTYADFLTWIGRLVQKHR